MSKDVVRGAQYVTGAQAAKLLGVKPQTLYAYVSRGLVQSIPSGAHRQHLYRRADIERLQLRSDARTGREAAAAGAMNFGDPIISSSITEITPTGPSYRGQLAIDLVSKSFSFEQVAEYLWTGDPPECQERVWPPMEMPESVASIVPSLTRFHGELPVIKVFSLVTVALSIAFTTRKASRPRMLRETIQTLIAALGLLQRPRRLFVTNHAASLAQCALHACGIEPTPAREKAVNDLMVLYSDHELSPPTFVARVAASVGADLEACLVSAIGSSSGSQADYSEISDLFSGIMSKHDLRSRIETFRAAEQMPPGFNSPTLYPHGDPRAPMFVSLARSCADDVDAIDSIADVLDDVRRKYDLYPKAQVGLKVIAIALGLSDDQALGIFIAARAAGWIAHVFEQYSSPAKIRPRAKYRAAEASLNGAARDVQ